MRTLVQTIAGTLALLIAAGTLNSESPPLSDIIKRVDPEDYRLRIRGRIMAYQHQFDPRITDEFKLENTPIIFPIVPDGGFHEVKMDQLKTTFELGDVEASEYFELIPANSLDTTFARFFIKEFDGTDIEFELEEIVRVWSSKVDEERALRLEWPESWPPEVASALQPQMYIESSTESVAQLLEKWTDGKAKSVSPYALAKDLARRVVSFYQVSGTIVSKDKQGFGVDGIEVRGANHAIKHQRGSLNDAVCLYVALVRAAGMPARPVIGIDRREKDQLVPWAEVFLPEAGWIPVDLRMLYKAPGRARDINRTWPGVGGYDDLNLMIPIAHHFHPPAGVMAAGLETRPLLWGWRPLPQAGRAYQSLNIAVDKAPRRGGGG